MRQILAIIAIGDFLPDNYYESLHSSKADLLDNAAVKVLVDLIQATDNTTPGSIINHDFTVTTDTENKLKVRAKEALDSIHESLMLTLDTADNSFSEGLILVYKKCRLACYPNVCTTSG